MDTQNTAESATSPFNDFIEEVVLELLNAHSNKASECDIKSCISTLDSLAAFVQSCPPTIKLDRVKGLLKYDKELFIDLIKPAVLRRLECE